MQGRHQERDCEVVRGRNGDVGACRISEDADGANNSMR